MTSDEELFSVFLPDECLRLGTFLRFATEAKRNVAQKRDTSSKKKGVTTTTVTGTMSMLNLSIQVLQHHESDSSSHAWLPAIDESLSATDRSLICRFLCLSRKVDTFPDDNRESHDRYLNPLMKERKAGARCKFRNSSPKTERLLKKTTAPDSAYESASDSSSLVPSDLQVSNFFSFRIPLVATVMIPRRLSVVETESQPSLVKEPATPDSTCESVGGSSSLALPDLQVPFSISFIYSATIMIPQRISVVEPESQPPVSSVILHTSRKCRSLSPKKKSPMTEPATPDTAYESVDDFLLLVPSGLQVPNFFSSTPPATAMISRKVSGVEPENQRLESSKVLQPRRKYPNHSPKKKSPMKEPATVDSAYESLGDSLLSVPSSFHVLNFFPVMPSATEMIPRRISVVEPESQPHKSSIVIHVDEKAKAKPARKERKYWNKITDGRLDHFGILSLRTAEALMQLGSSHMQCEEYKEALTAFRNATRIFRRVSGGYDLSTAMALNKVGLASCRLSKLKPNLRNAMDALNQSFSVRYELLGPTHVDTIDTLNNMAAIHLHLQEFQEARQAFFEVLTLRGLIFGLKYPSVAVTAHCLGRVYMRLGEEAEASTYYHNALDIYRDLRLSDDNPTLARLLTDVTRLGRG